MNIIATPETLAAFDRAVLAESLLGLPLVEAPYAALAARLGAREDDVLAALDRLASRGVLKRFGLVVHHRELGFRANSMCVFDVPDERLPAAAEALAALPFVTLCYRRTRRPPHWNYNLFCMIHGTDRDAVLAQAQAARAAAALEDCPSQVLFSRRRFKQCAGRYVAAAGGIAVGARAA